MHWGAEDSAKFERREVRVDLGDEKKNGESGRHGVSVKENPEHIDISKKKNNPGGGSTPPLHTRL